MSHQALDVPVELGNNHIPNVIVTMHKKFTDKELGVATLSEVPISALEFHGDLFPLFGSGVFQSRLNDANRVVLENEISDTTGDNLEEFRDELLPLVFGHMGLAAQSFPELFGPSDQVCIRLRRLALLLQNLLFGV